MYEFFLSTKELKKIAIFRYILFSKNGASLSDIFKEFNLNKSTGFRYVNELKLDVEKYFSENVFMSDDGNKLTIINKGVKSSGLVFDILRSKYVNDSGAFLVLQTVLKRDFPSIENLSQYLNVSPSTTYKYITQLQKLFHLFDCSVSFNVPGSVKGNELGIRILIYQTYWGIFKTIYEIPFKKIPEKFTEISNVKSNLISIENLSRSQRIKLTIIHGICTYRLSYRHQNLDVSDDFLEDIKYFSEKDFLLEIDGLNISSEVVAKESKVFAYLVRSSIYNIDTFKKRKEIVELYKKSNLEIANKVELLLKAFSKKFNIAYSSDYYIESYYVVLCYFIYFIHVPINYSELYENQLIVDKRVYNMQPEIDETLEQFRDFFAEFVKQEELPINDKAIDEFVYILYSIYDYHVDMNTVKIYIQNRTIYSGLTVKRMIEETFNSNLVTVVDNIDESDIVISSTNEGDEIPNNYFYFKTVLETSEWENLFAYISKYIFEKNFYKAL
ncbi:hypothetical protein ATZ33_06715 [Enterococcus silesiacus]|nr:helix-turn-helix domain-containing protein [Enterococcus silesiacus]ALS01070.1 hypothetical protein ATZ33_06715 [Enterococcus silesiacus]